LSTGNPSAGYYADPSVPGYIRYWDGSEWVAGSSRPAPEEPAARPQSPVQDGAGAGAGARRYGQVPKQFTPSPTQAPSPTQVSSPTPMPASMPFAQPASGSVPSVEHETPESVGTMIVPSAFAHAARSANSYVFPGQGGNPFTGLPSPAFLTPGQQSSVPGTTVVELAGPGSRILARIIDLGIAAIFSAPITVTLLLIAHQHDHQYVLKLDAEATTTYTTLGMDGLGIALWAGALLVLMIVSIFYEGNRLSRGGQTIGRKIAGVRVVRMPDGLPLGRDGVGTRRALLFWILAILPVLDILTLGSVFWGHPYRQGLHEKLTSTATIKA
jgi:RDD family/Protein of unknown function (DUF2510)